MENMKEWVDYGTLAVLGFMGFLALFFVFERMIVYRSTKLKEKSDKRELEIELTANLSVIYTIASNAPYVGLLGTVAGIMITFYTIGEAGLTDTREVMVGLALALKATGLGLVVAIPSMIFYNLLARKAEVLLARWDILHDVNPKKSGMIGADQEI